MVVNHMITTPPHHHTHSYNHVEISSQNAISVKTPRSSNLELYRIICMLMIVAHHYVVNSGLTGIGGPLKAEPTAANSLFLALFGAWGKTGINCFLMITGYFMCTSRITIKKFLKLMGQIYLYKLILFPIFLVAGYETVSVKRIVTLIMPVWGFSSNFVSCFIAFWLTIPFLNILVQNMTKRQHELLMLLLICCYTILGSVPTFKISFNYITWFGIIYIIASYFRLYPHPIFARRALWGWMTLLSMVLAMVSILGLQFLGGLGFYFVSDSNKFFAVVIAICSFLWFKNMNIKFNKIINAFGAATFGVLLIHAGSNAMRQWLWKDTLDVVGHYGLPFGQLVLFSVGVVLAVFIVCNLIDQLRIATIEKWFFNWYDCKYSSKVDAFVNRITSDKNDK